jgi:hypothetical protein
MDLEELAPESVQPKPKRGRPKKLTDHQIKAQEKHRAKPRKNKNESMFAMIRKMSKKDKKQLLKELTQVDSESESNSSGDELVLDSQSDIEVDNSLGTHYNIDLRGRNDRKEEEENQEEEEEEDVEERKSDRYFPAFLAKRLT